MDPTQGRTAAVLAALALATTLAGCTGTASPAPTVTRTALVTVTPTPSATPEFLIPAPEAGEITRSTYAYGQTTENSAPLPASGAVRLTAACASGGVGSIRYAMVDDQGAPAGLSGTVRCDGRPQGATAELGADRPSSVRIQLTAVGPVSGAYALLEEDSTAGSPPTSTPTASPFPGSTGTPSDPAAAPTPHRSSS